MPRGGTTEKFPNRSKNVLTARLLSSTRTLPVKGLCAVDLRAAIDLRAESHDKDVPDDRIIIATWNSRARAVSVRGTRVHTRLIDHRSSDR